MIFKFNGEIYQRLKIIDSGSFWLRFEVKDGSNFSTKKLCRNRDKSSLQKYPWCVMTKQGAKWNKILISSDGHFICNEKQINILVIDKDRIKTRKDIYKGIVGMSIPKEIAALFTDIEPFEPYY